MLNLFDRLSSWHDAQSFTQIKYLALGVCGLSTIGGAVFGALALRMKEGKKKSIVFTNFISVT